MKAKKNPWILEEESAPASCTPEDQSIVNSLVTLLMNLLSGKEPTKEMLSDAVVSTLSSSGKMESKSTFNEAQASLARASRDEDSSKVDLSNKQNLTKQLFKTIKQKTTNFKEMSRSQNKIVYGDPSDPENPEKQIEYHWNAVTNSWKIIPGPKANAFIPDETHNQLITINAGKAESYGTGRFFEVGTQQAVQEAKEGRMPSVQDMTSLDDRIREANKKLISQKMGQHRLYAFAVPGNKEVDLSHFMSTFPSETCNSGRSILLGDILSSFKPGELPNALETLCYTDKSNNWYVWKSIGKDGKLCIRYNSNGTLDVLIPDKSFNNEHLVIIGHKNIGPGGFAGGQLLRVKKDGSVEFQRNSDYTTPSFSGKAIRLSEQEITQHMGNARQAANAFLAGNEFVAEAALATSHAKERSKSVADSLVLESASSSPKKQPLARAAAHKESLKLQPRQKAVALATSRLEEQRAANPKLALPDNIKVTGLDGAPVFELHCPPFREKGCLDENGKPYEATVYFLKRTGSDVKAHKSNGVIIEVREKPYEIRLRSGWEVDDETHSVTAKVTVKHCGKEYSATLGEDDDGYPTRSKIEEASDNPLKNPGKGKENFMCIRGCCGHYSENNKRLMENPALARTL
jgi:hypothetical protein